MAKKSTNRKRKKKSKKLLFGRVIGTTVLLAMIATVVGFYIIKDLKLKWETRFESNTSVIFLLDNGNVVSNDVIYFDTEKYDQTQLGLFIEETISTYNKKHGEDSVVKESLSLENNVASLILTYKNAEIYEDFTSIELFMGDVADAVAEGYEFDGKFAKIEKGKATECSASEFTSQSDLKIAIVKANTKIQIEGEILYISAENVMGYGKNWIVTKEGCDLLEVGNQLETESDTDSSVGTGTKGTETENVDGSIDDPEPEQTESSTEIIFDFGDTELPPKEDVTYSEVYTYIIYR